MRGEGPMEVLLSVCHRRNVLQCSFFPFLPRGKIAGSTHLAQTVIEEGLCEISVRMHRSRSPLFSLYQLRRSSSCEPKSVLLRARAARIPICLHAYNRPHRVPVLLQTDFPDLKGCTMGRRNPGRLVGVPTDNERWVGQRRWAGRSLLSGKSSWPPCLSLASL